MVKVFFVGNLVADPELRETKGGHLVAQARVAVSTGMKDSEGEFISNFYTVSYWGVSGENFAKKAHKGDRVVVSGSLSASAIIGEKTNKAYVNLAVRADSMERVVPTGTSTNTGSIDDELE